MTLRRGENLRLWWKNGKEIAGDYHFSSQLNSTEFECSRFKKIIIKMIQNSFEHNDFRMACIIELEQKNYRIFRLLYWWT